MAVMAGCADMESNALFKDNELVVLVFFFSSCFELCYCSSFSAG